jgi:hypothetical protein
MKDEYLSYNKQQIKMFGPSVDELVSGKKIITPYPHLVCSKNFPLPQENGENLVVMVPSTAINEDENIFDIFRNIRLNKPESKHSFRFATQFRSTNKEETIIVFPHDPPFVPQDVAGAGQRWLTVIWRPGKIICEVCLYHIKERTYWPSNTYFAGIPF